MTPTFPSTTSSLVAGAVPGLRRRGRLGAYAAFVRVGFSRVRTEPAETVARALFLFAILGVFSALWRAAAAAGAHVGGDARTLVWYIALTEWVLMSAPQIQFQLEDDVRRGDVAYQVVRPVSYLAAQYAEGVGALMARWPLVLVGAGLSAWLFAGPPAHPLAVARAIGFGAAASLVVTAYNLVIGLAAFWLGDIAPVYWIWQKLLFVLGGLLLPLPLYPDAVVRVARLTPFPALLTGPASFVLDQPFFGGATLAAALAAWAAVAAAIAVVAFRAAVRRLQLNGG